MKQNKRLLMSYENFLDSVPEKSQDEAVEMYFSGSFRRIFISAVLFAFISAFSLTVDMFTGFYKRADQPLNFLHLIALSVMFGCSVVIIIFGKRDSKRPLSLRLYRFCHGFYYIAIGVALALFMFNEFYRGKFITYEQFYWIFFSVVPLMGLRFNFINYIVNAVAYTAEFVIISVIHNVPAVEFVYFLPVLTTFGIFGLYLRNYYLNDISFTLKNRELTELLTNRSRIDPLTGCLNRYVMQENFEELCKSGEIFSVFMFDIDNFKKYNDCFSHLKGDKCLADVSRRAIEICKQNGVDIFRYGGEEFVIFAVDMDEKAALKFAASLVKGIHDLNIPMPEEFSETNPYLTISLGMARFPVDKNIEMFAVISEADKQLYTAKNNGKNCVFYLDKKINIKKQDAEH